MFITYGDGARQPIGFSSMFVYSERSPEIPAAYISFFSAASECRFPQNAGVRFVIDGQTINFGQSARLGTTVLGSVTILSEQEGGTCNESINVIVPLADYVRIVNAKKVDLQIGKLNFSLEENQSKGLRELAHMIEAVRP
jgi:hypothetical protein